MPKIGKPSEVIGRMGNSGGVVAQAHSNLARSAFGKASRTEANAKPKSARAAPKKKS